MSNPRVIVFGQCKRTRSKKMRYFLRWTAKDCQDERREIGKIMKNLRFLDERIDYLLISMLWSCSSWWFAITSLVCRRVKTNKQKTLVFTNKDGHPTSQNKGVYQQWLWFNAMQQVQLCHDLRWLKGSVVSCQAGKGSTWGMIIAMRFGGAGSTTWIVSECLRNDILLSRSCRICNSYHCGACPADERKWQASLGRMYPRIGVLYY